MEASSRTSRGHLDSFENLLKQVSAQHKRDIETVRSNFDAELQELRTQAKELRVQSPWNEPSGMVFPPDGTKSRLPSIADEDYVYNTPIRKTSDDQTIDNATTMSNVASTTSPQRSNNFSEWVSGGVKGGVKMLFDSVGSMKKDKATPPDSPTLKNENRVLWSQVTHKLQEKSHHQGHLMLHFANAKGWIRKGKSTNKVTSRIQQIVEAQVFDAMCAIAIMLNTALLGVRIDYSAQEKTLNNLPVFFTVANYAFTTWFLIELVMRWTSGGFVGFFLMKGWRWNVFDVVVVGTDLVVTFMELVVGDQEELSNLTIMRTLRVLRTARALRTVRLVSFCRELRMMVLSILTSGMSLLWSMVLLFIIIFVFGIYLMQSVTQALARGDSDPQGKLEDFFGSLVKTMYTLFQTVSGGISWREVCDPLNDLHWTNGLVMSFFIFFTIFAMLNIITGIFVQTAISSVQHDDDEVIQEEVGSTDSLIEKLGRVFQDADTECRGVITMEQFEGILSDNRTGALMAGLGLDISEASSMFSLMDLDLSGNISLEEFLVGCMRMRGSAKSVDVVSLLYENKKLVNRWKAFESYVMAEFKQIHVLEKQVSVILRLLQGQGQGKPQGSQGSSSVDVTDPTAEARLSQKCSAIDKQPYVHSNRVSGPATP